MILFNTIKKEKKYLCHLDIEVCQVAALKTLDRVVWCDTDNCTKFTMSGVAVDAKNDL